MNRLRAWWIVDAAAIRPTSRAPTSRLWPHSATPDKPGLGSRCVYDFWNRLAQVTLSGSTIVYAYDALGRRLMSQLSEAATRLLASGTQPT
jgi:hypothetical protein